MKRRRGYANRSLILLGGSLALLLVLLLFLFKQQGWNTRGMETPLTLYCAAGIKRPVEAAAREYQAAYGAPIEIQYGGSGTLLANIEVARMGDLYLAADESYIRLAREKGLAAESIPLAWLTPGIAVAEGNPKGITGIQDLLKEDIRVALANPDAAAVGRITRMTLTRAGLWAALEKKTKVFKPTVNDLATDVSIKAVDAAIIWDATANQDENIDFIRVEEFASVRQRITIGLLKSSEAPTQALRFARFLSSRDRGQPFFKAAGFEGVDGDVWEVEPRVVLFSGAMLRPGVEETIKAFEEREGCSIERVYNGCGILVAQMKAGASPEAYLACDVTFMDMVEDRFEAPKDLTENDIVLAVAKGNPKGLKTLADLAHEGLRVGLAHPVKSALGYLTRLMLEDAGLYDAIGQNVAVESATGDFLLNQILTGSLDAVLVYRTNVMANPENLKKHLDMIPVDLPGALAVQPFAVARKSRHPFLMQRLYEAIVSETSKERFEKVGFRWRGRTGTGTDTQEE